MGHDIEVITRGVWVEAGRILLCRNRQRGHVFLPGGHVEFGEAAEAALLREIKEEIGLELEIGRFLGAMEGRFSQASDRQGKFKVHHEINLVFSLVRPPTPPSPPEASPAEVSPLAATPEVSPSPCLPTGRSQKRSQPSVASLLGTGKTSDTAGAVRNEISAIQELDCSPAGPNSISSKTPPSPPAVRSREEAIEFFWADISQVFFSNGFIDILPRGIIQLAAPMVSTDTPVLAEKHWISGCS